MGLFSGLKKVAGTVANVFTGGAATGTGLVDSDDTFSWSKYMAPVADIGSSLVSRYWATSDSDKQWNRDLAMWNMTNAYNSPTAQMQRLKEAGLNPNLVYGSGNVVGNAAGSVNAPSTRGSQKINNPISALLTAQQLKVNDENILNLQAEREVRASTFFNNMLEAGIRAHNLRIAQERGLPVGAPYNPITMLYQFWNGLGNMIEQDRELVNGTFGNLEPFGRR